MTHVTRRTAIALTGAAATTLGLAACSAPGGDAPNPGSGGGLEATKDPSGTLAVESSKVPVGGSVIVSTNAGSDPAIAIAQPKAGDFVAHTAVCTHQGCIVAAAGAQLHCPCHGSKFDAFTGKVINGPARLPLDAVQVTVNGSNLEFSV
ncbi:ubiquinol-cytochrome c reductase iron-sulfur subunit [Gryllotalpicola reticulitermitis]|uniref:Cytochrome bc1 complex Rieske iron-sulfur subunit n=1 Tax=Gryllotalpicola reticulitermitis TaxID=1184153 RepID=A0ABV8Q668_9MICO